MSHHVHTPSPAPARRRMFRYMMVMTSAAFIAGGIASLPASTGTGPHAAPAAASGVGADAGRLIGIPGR
ncbi:hypothetical protein [Streptomyces sp. NPDC127112]|uniref:hypothetical protein n=1 Tax=Streptomyces sp. NPDC127112 TaxID=3345364 RepID=UPI0036421989